jgi:hypothetical protein
MLLKMNLSNIDDIVVKFNEDSVWADPRFIAQVVSSVTGSRKNSAELIEFMTKISETRGYSALLRQVDAIIGKLRGSMADPSLEEEIADAIIRGCRNPLTDTAKW